MYVGYPQMFRELIGPALFFVCTYYLRYIRQPDNHGIHVIVTRQGTDV